MNLEEVFSDNEKLEDNWKVEYAILKDKKGEIVLAGVYSISLMMEKFTQRRKLIHEGLNSFPGVECSLPGGAFYAFPKVIGTGMDGSEFCKRAMHEAGVAIVPGTAFGKTCKDYVRFSFAASRDNISNALENIKKMLG